MFFVLQPAAGTRLLNTPKEGYPFFDENALRAGNHRVLAAFARQLKTTIGSDAADVCARRPTGKQATSGESK